MIKKVLFFIISISLSSLSLAQNKDYSHFGLHTGLNVMSAIQTTDISSKSQAGFQVGVNYHYDFNKYLQLNTGISFSLRRLHLFHATALASDSLNPNPNTHIRFEVNSFRISTPVFLKMKFLEKEKSHFFINPGIEPTIIFNGNHKAFLVSKHDNFQSSADLKLKDFILFAGLGVGYEFEVMKKRRIYLNPMIKIGTIKNDIYPFEPITGYRPLSFCFNVGVY